MISAGRPLAILALLMFGALAGCAGKSEGLNTAPTAELEVLPGETANVWTLDGSKSVDPDADALTYHWNWVLGNSTTTQSKIQVEFPPEVAAGDAQYIVTLTVRDERGDAGVALGAVAFGNGENKPPTPDITAGPRWVQPGDTVVLDAEAATKDPEGDGVAYEWIWGPLGTYDPKAMNMKDACLESETTLAYFSTGCLDEGQAFNLTFDQQGTFNIHCHPHPWMKARIVVDASMPAESKDYPIANFGYPETMIVGVGSTLNFVNLDPVAHTATIEDWTPGTKSGGTSPVFEQTLDEGEYVVRLIVTDAKGARSTKTWGLKASSDAPENPQVANWTAATPLAPNQKWDDGQYNLTYEALVTAVLKWDDATGSAFLGNFSVGRVDPGGGFAKQNNCVAREEAGLAGEAREMRMTCVLKPDKYVFVVEAARDGSPGFLPEWELAVTGIVRTNPGFGDSGAGDGHDHAH